MQSTPSPVPTLSLLSTLLFSESFSVRHWHGSILRHKRLPCLQPHIHERHHLQERAHTCKELHTSATLLKSSVGAVLQLARSSPSAGLVVLPGIPSVHDLHGHAQRQVMYEC